VDPWLKIVESVFFCSVQNLGKPALLPVHGVPPFVTPKDAIASLHSS
jgi:hypothetical protein